MKKILAVLLATSSVAVFADSFQDFNNNAYLTYNYTGVNTPTLVGDVNSYYSGYGVGATFQSKNNVWVNASATAGTANATIDGFKFSGNSGALDIRAGYAFQFFGNDDNGFQVIPFASFAAINTPTWGATDASNTSYAYGLGVQPEYRFLSSLKVDLALGLIGTQTPGSNQSFNYVVTPEVQYDIAKTIMLSVGYTYSGGFNAENNSYGANGSNGFTAKVGYLF